MSWTEDEDNIVRRMHRTKRTTTEIARRLNRSYFTVAQRMKELKLGKWSNPPPLVVVLLQAAAMFDGEFSDQDLTVGVWKLAPLRFGLRGFPQYADSKVVGACLAGKKGPIKRGWITRTGPGALVLTDAGRAKIRMEKSA